MDINYVSDENHKYLLSMNYYSLLSSLIYKHANQTFIDIYREHDIEPQYLTHFLIEAVKVKNSHIFEFLLTEYCFEILVLTAVETLYIESEITDLYSTAVNVGHYNEFEQQLLNIMKILIHHKSYDMLDNLLIVYPNYISLIYYINKWTVNSADTREKQDTDKYLQSQLFKYFISYVPVEYPELLVNDRFFIDYVYQLHEDHQTIPIDLKYYYVLRIRNLNPIYDEIRPELYMYIMM